MTSCCWCLQTGQVLFPKLLALRLSPLFRGAKSLDPTFGTSRPQVLRSSGYWTGTKPIAIHFWGRCLNMEVSWSRGTPVNHPILDGIFHLAIGVPPWLWKPPYHPTNHGEMLTIGFSHSKLTQVKDEEPLKTKRSVWRSQSCQTMLHLTGSNYTKHLKKILNIVCWCLLCLYNLSMFILLVSRGVSKIRSALNTHVVVGFDSERKLLEP